MLPARRNWTSLEHPGEEDTHEFLFLPTKKKTPATFPKKRTEPRGGEEDDEGQSNQHSPRPLLSLLLTIPPQGLLAVRQSRQGRKPRSKFAEKQTEFCLALSTSLQGPLRERKKDFSLGERHLRTQIILQDNSSFLLLLPDFPSLFGRKTFRTISPSGKSFTTR